MEETGEEFQEHALGFRLRIPDGWQFQPPAWSPMERFRRQPDAAEWAALASKPFCCAQRMHEVVGYAHPTLQATVRPLAMPRLDQLPAMLDSLVEGLSRAHPSFELEERTSDAIIAGYPALRCSGRLGFIQTWPDGTELEIGARSRSVVVFARGLAFNLGLSGSDDARYYDEAEFDFILRSVRIR